jgi:hypothetical protein
MARDLRRSARAAAARVRSAAASLARTSWVAVSQAHASWMTSRGEPDRRTGPEVRFPAPVIVALSSPNVVSGALHRREIGVPDLAGGRGLVIEEGGDHGAGPGCVILPVAGGQDDVVLGGAHGEPVLFLP